MIDVKKLDAQWFTETGKEIHGDPLLLEKVVRAFLLVEGLVQGGLKFIFKGGTALMLLMDKPARFSIDVDILLPVELVKTDLTALFDSIVEAGRFTGYEPRPLKKAGMLKKEHYKFFYQSSARTAGTQDSIILDIVFEDGLYNKILSLPVSLPFIPASGKNISVAVPDADNLLGDKLTAFAPNSSGIPYIKNGNSMSLEIIKQLYDIGKLFPFAKNPARIRDVFLNCVRKQAAYQDNRFSIEEVREDIFQTALCLATKGKTGTSNYPELEAGVRRVGNFIFLERYTIPKAVIDASIAAYLSMLMSRAGKKMEKIDQAQALLEREIKVQEFTILNKLKKSNPEAFIYWYKAIETRSLR